MATNNAVNTSLSGQSGTGSFAGTVSPSFTTPTLGVAAATSVNKVAVTAPATASTLTIADGKTLTQSNTLTYTGTDGSSVNFGAGGTVAYVAGSGGLKSFQIFTSGTAQTYTKPAGITSILVEVIGGGGGGGGSTGGASTSSVGGAGGGGGYARLFVASASSTYTYTVGVGGTAGTSAGGTGGTGGTTTFSASSLQATGGIGGTGLGAIASVSSGQAIPGAGGIGSNGNINVQGNTGTFGATITGFLFPGKSGESVFGGGVSLVASTTGAGVAGGNYGSGGSGGISSTVSFAGGAGSAGLIIVWEFA